MRTESVAKGRVMAIYTITFISADGGVLERCTLECGCDDDAIDIVGESAHPHAIDIHEGERHVVRCPPWSRGLT